MKIREDYTGRIIRRSLCGDVDEFLKHKEFKLKEQLQGLGEIEETPANQKRGKRRAAKNNMSLNMTSIGSA